jgi:type IV secretory pathway TrbL component
MTAGDLQGLLTAAGIFLTGAAAFVSAARNAVTLKRVERNTNGINVDFEARVKAAIDELAAEKIRTAVLEATKEAQQSRINRLEAEHPHSTEGQ